MAEPRLIFSVFPIGGQTAMITGGTREIGKSMTLALAADILLIQVINPLSQSTKRESECGTTEQRTIP